jgi:hypothetical protein
MPQSELAAKIRGRLAPPMRTLTAARTARVLYQWCVRSRALLKSKVRNKRAGSRIIGPQRILLVIHVITQQRARPTTMAQACMTQA